MDIRRALEVIAEGASAEELEGPDLEFKQLDSSLKRSLEIVADAVVCLANSNGGTVVVGVADRVRGPAAIIGVGSDLSTEMLARGVFDRTRPALSVPIVEVAFGDRLVLEVTVPRGATFYANAKGTATRRVGHECRPFPPEEQRQALSSRGIWDWSAGATTVDPDRADPGEVGRLRRLLVRSGRQETARQDDAQLLDSLSLLTEGSLTWAGLLLVGTPVDLREHVPQYGYSYQYRASAGIESSSRFREYRPLLAAVDQLLDAVETRRVVHSLNLSGGVQLQLHDYPSAAVRELVINALVHRDYEVEGAVDVEHSPERLAISSPGGLVFGVTTDNILTHPSTPRNRLLLDTVTLLGVAERTGQGVDRAYREMLRIGKPPPEHDDLETRTEARLHGGNGDDAFVRFIDGTLDEQSAVDVNVLLALDLLRTRRSLDATAVAARIQRSAEVAQTVLARLSIRGLVAPTRRTQQRTFPTYALTGDALAAMGRAVTYHRPTPAERDVKIVEHIGEYDFVTNQTLRRMFDITLYQARNMLRDLQGRGILRKLDDRTGGRGVRYGPGPRFQRADDELDQ